MCRDRRVKALLVRADPVTRPRGITPPAEVRPAEHTTPIPHSAHGGSCVRRIKGTIGLVIAGRTAMWSRSSTCGWRRARRHPRSRLRGTCGRRAAQRSRRGRAAAIHAAVVQRSMGNCPHVSSPPTRRRRHPPTDGYSRSPASPIGTARARPRLRLCGRRRRRWTACTAVTCRARAAPRLDSVVDVSGVRGGVDTVLAATVPAIVEGAIFT
jgi:hypothetical protein